jgi:hypothetical protein
MSAPDRRASSWTLDTLYTHVMELREADDRRYAERFEASQKAIEAALLAQKEAVNTALAAHKEAVTKAENATERRFESVNEFRKQLNDQQATYISRTEVDARQASMAKDIAAMTKELDRLRAEREGSKLGWAAAIALGGIVLTVGGAIVGAIVFMLQRNAAPGS